MRKDNPLLDILFPPRCPFCGKIIYSGEQTCDVCSNIHPKVCVRPLFSTAHAAVTCYAAYPYQDQVRNAVLRMKFGDEPSICTFFGHALAEMIREQLPKTCFDAVTAVPMSHLHQFQRGYNQSELLAKAASGVLHVPYCRLLKKSRRNRTQHRLPAAERFHNVQGVYQARKTFTGKQVLLIDDIITTGAALTVCAKQLLQAGARSVTCAAATFAVPEEVADKD